MTKSVCFTDSTTGQDVPGGASMMFTIFFVMNEPSDPGFMEKDEMIELAKSMMGYDVSLDDELDPNFIHTIEDAEDLAGFNIFEPHLLPEGYHFSYAQYYPEYELVKIMYSLDLRSGTSSLTILQWHLPSYIETGPTERWEIVMLNGDRGKYLEGAPFSSSRTLMWETDGLHVEIHFDSNSVFGGRLTKDEMIAIAESMR